MITINKLMPRGAGLAPVLLKRAATIELDWDTRQKSRFDATDSAGRSLGIFLPRGTAVRGGDVLVAEDGSLVRVIAAAQPVLRITHCTQHGSPFDLIRAAYHLGNRHVPIELRPDHLKIEPDHVLADMLRAMHLIVHAETSAFEPENGAYAAGGHTHGHDHDHGHGHDHADDHDHDHDHGLAHAHGRPQGQSPAQEPHVHGPDCGHDHSHDAHQHHGHHGHTDRIQSFVFRSDRPFDHNKLEDFLWGILEVFGEKMLRYKGVLYVKGSNRKVVFQGVHQMMGSDMAGLWGAEPKQTRMVFIGIDLPKDTLMAGLEGCLA